MMPDYMAPQTPNHQQNYVSEMILIHFWNAWLISSRHWNYNIKNILISADNITIRDILMLLKFLMLTMNSNCIYTNYDN